MALADHKDLLTTLYGLKTTQNPNQLALLREQYRNDLMNIQLKNRNQQVSKLTSDYEKLQKDYKDISDKISSYNRQMEFFQNPQKYPAWKSNPYVSMNMLGADPSVVQVARDRDLFNKVTQKRPWLGPIYGAGHFNVSPGAQERITNQVLTERNQQGGMEATPEVRANIQVPAIGARTDRMNAQASLRSADANYANSPAGAIQLIEGLNIDAERKKMLYQQALGLDPMIAEAFMLADTNTKISYLLGQSGATDAVQRRHAGLPADPPKSPASDPLARPRYDAEQMKLAAIRQVVPGYNPGDPLTPEQSRQANAVHSTMLAEQYGIRDKPTGAGTGSGSVSQRNAASAISNAFSSLANLNLGQGESVEFGKIAALNGVNTMIKWANLNNIPLGIQMNEFTAAMREVAQQIGTNDQTPHGQSMAQLLAEGGDTMTFALEALQKSGGKPVTLESMGINPDPIVRASIANPGTINPAAYAELIPDFEERKARLLKNPLPVDKFPRTNPQQSKYLGRPDHNQMRWGMGTKSWSQSMSRDRHGFRIGQIVSVNVPGQSQVDRIEITKDRGTYYIAKPLDSSPNLFGVNKQEFRLDPKYIVKYEPIEGDTVRIGFIPPASNTISQPSRDVIIVKVGRTGNESFSLPTGEIITVPQGWALVMTSKGEYVEVPIVEIMGKIGSRNAAVNTPGVNQPNR